jgi:hypothetical protein
MYLVIERYEMQKVASVGYITLVHPTLTWLPKLVNDLITAMQNAQLPKSDVDDWKERTKTEYDESTDNTPVPPFHLSKKAFAFGNGNLRVERTLLQVNCAIDDAKYLKTTRHLHPSWTTPDLPIVLL